MKKKNFQVFLIKWSDRSSQLCWLLNLEWLSRCGDTIQSLLNTSFWYSSQDPHVTTIRHSHIGVCFKKCNLIKKQACQQVLVISSWDPPPVIKCISGPFMNRTTIIPTSSCTNSSKLLVRYFTLMATTPFFDKKEHFSEWQNILKFIT
jgi:hypothetical protein